MPSTFEGVSGNPLLGLTRKHEQRLKVIEAEEVPLRFSPTVPSVLVSSVSI
jgi:hypothetical protein